MEIYNLKGTRISSFDFAEDYNDITLSGNEILFRSAKECGIFRLNGVLRFHATVAEEMGIPLEKVYGVSTFYSQFSLYPKGKYKISVCLGTACYVKGSGDIFAKLSEKLGISDGKCTQDGIFSLDACRCIGACGLAPVMTVNDDVYGKLTVDEIDGILAKYTE